MYECPNCAANLKFDIVRQVLACEHCGGTWDPYAISREKDAEETQNYEVTVFTCPQCGGELLSEDTTAATFCSYCGASTILDSRVSRERRPERIVPFTRTKEDCREAYRKLLRRAVFAPGELKDPAHIDQFRGIYMPYWVYGFTKEGKVTIPGSRTHRQGDYRITQHYDLDCELEESYQGIAYDASSTFSDSLSMAIAPFDLKEGKPFTPSFLSGFYADTNDLHKGVYRQAAQKVFLEDACERAKKALGQSRYHVGEEGNRAGLERALKPDPKDVSRELAMLPVWFLSYQRGDRVAYAVVNGQTGKAAADLPVDPRKYLAGSLLLALPIFLLLNGFLTVTPVRSLVYAMLLALASLWVSHRQLARLAKRESGADDIQSSVSRKRPAAEGASFPGMLLRVIGVSCAMLMFLELISGDFQIRVLFAWIREAAPLLLLFVGIRFFFSRLAVRRGKPDRRRKAPAGETLRGRLSVLYKPILALVLSLLILAVHPVRDEFYYLGSAVCMGMIGWSFLDILRRHNLLTTRRLPQLNRRGGDENA